jgi:hypothetical protein
VLAGLVHADHLAHLDPGLGSASELAGLDAGDDGGEQLLGDERGPTASAASQSASSCRTTSRFSSSVAVIRAASL